MQPARCQLRPHPCRTGRTLVRSRPVRRRGATLAQARGIVAAIGYGWWYVDPQVDAIIGERLLKLVEPHWLPGNWLLIDGYRDLRLPCEEVRLTPAAVHLAWERQDVEAYVLSWSVVQKLGTDVTANAFATLREVWPDGQKRHVTMPIVSRVHRL